MKIYTKTGDKGETSLYGGKRIYKNDTRIEAYGSVDELNCTLGVILSILKDKKIKVGLTEIQKDLMVTGSALACYKIPDNNYFKEKAEILEKWIDEADDKLPKLNNFILPGGNMQSALLHQARSICRRAERRAVELSRKEEIDRDIIVYLNRLSDLLFVLARYINFKTKNKEIIWKL